MTRTRVLGTWALSALLAAGLAAPRPAWATGEATFGAQNWWQTARESKYQEFRQQPNGAFVEDFRVRGGIGSLATGLWGNDLFLTHQAMGLSVDKGIRWQFDGSYQQLPHLFSQIARSPFMDQGGGVYAISDSIQAQNQANPAGYVNRMNALMATAPYIPLSHRTDVTDARLRVRPARSWQLQFDAERRKRTGTKQYALSFGQSNTNEITEPIDQNMTDVRATASYARGGLTARGSLGYSAFDNRVDALTVDNATRIVDSPTAGSSRGRLDLYPSNDAVHGQFDLGARITPRLRYAGTLALSHHRQDDPWLPFTINTAISQASQDSLYGSISGRSTDATALRFTQNHRFTGRFGTRLKGDVHFRQQHYSNDTPEYHFRGTVRYDQNVVRDTAFYQNHPFGNQQVTLGTDWDMRVADGVNVLVGYDHRWREHTYREVENDREDEFRGRVYANLENGLYASGGAAYSTRRLDDFNLADYRRPDAPDTVFLENPLLRRFDVADRDRKAADAEVGYALSSTIDLSVSGEFANSDYLESTYGLQEEERWMVIGQVMYTPMRAIDLSGGYGFGRIDTDQSSEERSSASSIPITTANTGAGNTWVMRIRDRNDYGFVNLTWRVSPRTLTVSTNYWVSRDQISYYSSIESPGTAAALPATYYLRQEGRLEARYRLPDGTDLIGRYGYDTWKIDDFAAENIPLLATAGTPATASAIYLGAGYQDYTAHSLALAISRRF